jgi:hypothetical protein
MLAFIFRMPRDPTTVLEIGPLDSGQSMGSSDAFDLQ